MIPTLARTLSTSNQRIDFETETLLPVAFTCKDHGADAGDKAPTLRAMGHSGSHANAGGQVAVAFDTYNHTTNQTTNQTLQRGTGTDQIGAVIVTHTLRGDGFDASEDGTGRGTPLVPVTQSGGVRRLTPRETERLQGFDDDWTAIPLRRAKPFPGDKSLRKKSPDRFRMVDGEEWLFAADGPRYKAVGNSMAVPVMQWIAERIAMVEKIR